MATGDKLVNLDELKLVYDKLHVPSVQVQIPTGQWSGSSTRTYTVNATNVTADTIIDWAMDSSINYLKADLTVTPGSGTIQFSTTAIPAGTINVTLFFPGVKGEVVIQTLADVYSKSQVDQKISQSTANTNLNGTVTGYLPVKNTGCAIFSSGNASSAYNVMSQLVAGRCVPFFIANADAASLLTDGKLTSLVKGILSRSGANGQFYDFVGGPGGGYNKMYSWRVIATSASDMSLQAVYEFTGTQI